ncbi:hypothetical protein H310_06275 [Aphanomyces invadans]|uniref:UBC core domain-containing protein n=1 Tax=Aphanomyces invadans TaxID=157072 RepID=A0A024U5V2_9STRA|nr:hypothetical protein H310_06275 [Aphanomyces invadans]ETW01649.1 hypothetical protein H310_06275 [Aphanomyces invadans]|eukprot:XP_008869497.1 hypothetical protein H310_06275 [Aphanomyces invadans]
MDEILTSTFYTAIIASKTDERLSPETRASIDDLQSYCHELKCCKRPAAFVKCLKDLFLFELLMGLLDSLLLQPSEQATPEKRSETVKNAPVAMVQPSIDRNNGHLWKPFYLHSNEKMWKNKHESTNDAPPEIPRTVGTILATHVLQLWLALVQACTKMNVSALYFDEVKGHILHPRFSVIIEQWLYDPTLEHVVQQLDLCAALVAIIVYLHNHPFFDATCFLRSVAAGRSLPIQTCLSSFFTVVSEFPPDHPVSKTFSQLILEIKFVRSDKVTPVITGAYEQALDPMKFGSHQFDASYFDCVGQTTTSTTVLPGSMGRLNQELLVLAENLPLHEGSMIAVRVDETHPHHLSVVITGPSNTPYDTGCFHFLVVVPPNYPQGPPAVRFMTTGGGTVRFSPNLYDCGKVCLSLLGTWSGDPWNVVTSTILQVLVSIQGAILGAELPYFNEPGRERQWASSPDQLPRGVRTNPNGGLEPLRLATIRYAWTGAMKSPPVAFEDFVREHFWQKRHCVLRTMHKWLDEGRASDSLHYYDDLIACVAECLDILSPMVQSRATQLEWTTYCQGLPFHAPSPMS